MSSGTTINKAKAQGLTVGAQKEQLDEEMENAFRAGVIYGEKSFKGGASDIGSELSSGHISGDQGAEYDLDDDEYLLEARDAVEAAAVAAEERKRRLEVHARIRTVMIELIERLMRLAWSS